MRVDDLPILDELPGDVSNEIAGDREAGMSRGCPVASGRNASERIQRRGGANRLPPYNQLEMIYCVIPRELEAELFDKMVEYYKDNPNVTVIVDRREGPDRRSGKPEPEFLEKRETRDRRRARIPGTFPDTDLPGE